MGRPKKAKPAEPETAPEAAPATSTISKAEAVRQALSAGMETPEDGTGFIKSNYGIEISKQMWSSYASQQKARDSKKADGAPKGKPGRKPRATVEGYLAPPPKKATGEADLLETLEALKPLIASHGADRVKRLVDLLG